MFKRNTDTKKQNGAISIIMALFLLFLMLPLLALAIDLGNLYVVRNQLQNAADSAALAKANYLWYNNNSNTPNWSVAESAPVSSNTAGGVAINTYEVDTGYWNLNRTPSNLQATSIIPQQYDVPAVRVHVIKEDSNAGPVNGGPAKTFFGGLIGLGEVSISAEAIATAYIPGSVNPGTLFPIAISKLVADARGQYNNPDDKIRIGSGYHYGPTENGQWTSLLTGSPDVPTVRDLIYSGNPDPVDIGDPIFIQPGTENTLYNNTASWLVDGGGYRDVVFPVIDWVIDNQNTNLFVPVYSYVGFRITDSIGGSDKYIEGYFLDEIGIGGGGIGGGTGPNYGVYVYPVLVQ